MFTYLIGLLWISCGFLVLERALPRRAEQRALRPGLATDMFYLVFNGHFVGAGLAVMSAPLQERLRGYLEQAERSGWWMDAVAATWPWWVQALVAFLAMDLMQWGVHNLLHRVPWLWEFHKVHHSIQTMDFWGSFRFHWMEVVVYKTLLYLPAVWFGFDGPVLLGLAFAGTVIGHMNHANVRFDPGPLGFVFNHPKMHLWHHHHEPGHPPHINFGINLSLWDYVFGTAHVPDHAPSALGFDDVELFPQRIWGQLLYPFLLWPKASSENSRNTEVSDSTKTST